MASTEPYPLPISYNCLACAHPGRQAASILTGKGGSHSRSDGRSATWAARVAAAGGVDDVSAARNGSPARDGAASGDVCAPRDVRIGGGVGAAGGHPAWRSRVGVAVPAVWATPDLRASPRDPRRRAVSAGLGLSGPAWLPGGAWLPGAARLPGGPGSCAVFRLSGGTGLPGTPRVSSSPRISDAPHISNTSWASDAPGEPDAPKV